MKKLSWVLGAAWILGAVQACGSAEHDKPQETPEFSSHVPGDKTLESLSADEVADVCRAADAFLEDPVIRADACRFDAVVAAALAAALSPDATDAQLRAICSESYDQCVTDAAASDDACDPNVFSENCAASVSEYGACLDETMRDFHQFAEQLSCSAFSRHAMSEMSAQDSDLDSSGACAAFLAKCPGISQVAEDFVDEYCARVSPCCSGPKLGDDCRTLALRAAQDLQFDADAATACLARLGQYQAEPEFCSSIGQSWYHSGWGAAIPECEGVFSHRGGSGDLQAGATCIWDDECAAPERGIARCVSTDVLSESTCVHLTKAEAGDPCLGTAGVSATETDWVAEATPDGSSLCYHSEDLRCDARTRTCVGARALGEACSSTLECASDAYCAPNGVCSVRLVEGARCDFFSGECAGTGACTNETRTCTLPLPAGAACPASGDADCASGVCEDGVCSDPLALLCGER